MKSDSNKFSKILYKFFWKWFDTVLFTHHEFFLINRYQMLSNIDDNNNETYKMTCRQPLGQIHDVWFVEAILREHL